MKVAVEKSTRKSPEDASAPPKAPSDFRLYLQTELLRRCKTNPKYSLRAFARALALEPAFLSKLLHGKRGITINVMRNIASRLALAPSEVKKFEDAILLKKSSKRQTRLPASPETQFQQLALDHFQMIADWYHYAILELVSVEGFESSPRYIARMLGISVNEANAAIERLLRLEYLELAADGSWTNHSGNNTTLGNDFTATAFRKLQKQVLEMALVALEEVPIEQRDQTSMTMAIDSAQLPEAKKMIKEFRRSFCDVLQKSTHRDSVYHLGVSLYPVTRRKNEN